MKLKESIFHDFPHRVECELSSLPLHVLHPEQTVSSQQTLQHFLRNPLIPVQWLEMPSFFHVIGSIRSNLR